MGDVRSDPRTNRLLNSVPGDADSVSQAFAALAHQAQTTSDELTGAQQAPGWTGKAASAYRKGIHHLPLRMQQIGQAYATAAPALETYAQQLSSAKATFVVQLADLDQAEAKLAAANQQLAAARAAMPPLAGLTGSPINTGSLLFGSAAPTPSAPASPAAIQSAAAAVQSATGAVTQAQDEVNTLQANCYGILNDVDQCQQTAATTVANAYQIVPAPDTDGHLFLPALKQAGGFVPTVPPNGPLGYVNSVISAGGQLPKDASNVYNTGSASSIAQLSGDLGTLAGSLAFVSAVGRAAGVGADVLATVGRAAAVTGTGLQGVKTGADIDQAANGQGDPAAIVQDLVNVAAGGVSIPGAGSKGGIKFPGTADLNTQVTDLQTQADAATDPAVKAALEAEVQAAKQQAATVGALNSSLGKIIGQQIGDVKSAADPHPTP